MAGRIVDASFLCLPVGCHWPISAREKLRWPSLYLWLSFLHGGTGEDSEGSLLLLAAEAMLGVFSGGVWGWFIVTPALELSLDGLFLEGPLIYFIITTSQTLQLDEMRSLHNSPRRLCRQPIEPSTWRKLKVSATSMGNYIMVSIV